MAVLLLTLAWSSSAQAEPSPAKVAYDRATTEFEAKSYSAAATDFALADELSPNPVALESALKAALLADDPLLGMELVERAKGRPSSPAIDALVTKSKDAFAKRTGKLTVRCPESHVCSATLVLAGASGGVARMPLETGKARWLRAGTLVLDTTFEGTYARHQVDVLPESDVTFEVPKPAPPPPPPVKPVDPPSPGRSLLAPKKDMHGAHPAFFGVTAGLFVASAAVTIWSGVDTLNLHQEWLDHGDETVRQDGLDAQLRTNVMFGVMGGGLIATTLVGVFTDWDGVSVGVRVVRVEAAPQGARLTVSF